MTRLDEEREAQKSWRLKRPGAESTIEKMLRREFLEPAASRELAARELGRILRFARSEVPYYRSHKAWAGLALNAPVDREVLATLPILSKRDVQDNVVQLQAERLPRILEFLSGLANDFDRFQRVLLFDGEPHDPAGDPVTHFTSF